MRAGDLRDSIALQSSVDSQDAAGQPIKAWSTYATVPAAYEPVRGREYGLAPGQIAETAVRFRIRGGQTVLQKHRVVFNGLTYDIRGVITDAKGRETVLECDNGVTAA